MRVLVTGSRHLTAADAPQIRRALLHAVRHTEGRHTLVHGDATGADTLAKLIAEDLGWETEPYPALWEEDGYPQAGPIRNQRMVDTGVDVCVAFPAPDSRGTYDCMRRAKKALVPVIEGWTVP